MSAQRRDPCSFMLRVPEAPAEFSAIDVETANADMASICQIGIAHFRDGVTLKEWKTYVNPEDYFDEINISIHGIDESTVRDAPIFPEIADHIYGHLDDHTAVCHTHFDRVAILQASAKYGLRLPKCTWLDSARVARRAWPQFERKGYGLDSICSMLGYQYKHHDALEDAKAAAQVLLAATERTGLSVEDWLQRVERPIDPSNSSGHIIRDRTAGAPFYGEVLVFTGALTIPRSEAANLAAKVGFSVAPGVTKETTILVVGDQDVRKLAGYEKSSKHRKAETLARAGQAVRIIKEADFLELVRSYDTIACV
jgi:DNA polymerase III subunit epsilon